MLFSQSRGHGKAGKGISNAKLGSDGIGIVGNPGKVKEIEGKSGKVILKEISKAKEGRLGIGMVGKPGSVKLMLGKSGNVILKEISNAKLGKLGIGMVGSPGKVIEGNPQLIL